MSDERILINVGHSPDPDDAFMFHALANDKIDTGKYRFTHTLQDIETLNHRAFKAELELTALAACLPASRPTRWPFGLDSRCSSIPLAFRLRLLV